MEVRRIKAVYLGIESIGELVKGNSSLEIVGLPKDALAVQANYDILSNCVVVFFEHDSFEPVPFGQMVPQLDHRIYKFKTEDWCGTYGGQG